MTRLLCTGFCMLVIAACRDTDHVGYTRLWNSLHYRHEVLGEEGIAVKNHPDGYVSFHLEVVDEHGRSLASKQVERIPVHRLSEQGAGVEKAVRSMHLEDSTGFVGLARELRLDHSVPRLRFAPDSLVRFTLRVDELLSENEIRQVRARERAQKDLEMKEVNLLGKVLDSLGLDTGNEISGIYYKSLREGQGEHPVSGATVWVNYIGRFASGETFDNTYAGKLALEYEIGRPDQVIPGFATGISQMREGGRAIFVIPSTLGFGAKGSSSGIVPPFTTLIYEVELVRVGV